jgi:excisionase family DNA binding protein
MSLDCPYLLTSDVAAILAVSPSRVYQLERQGRLSAIRTARGVRLFDRREVERLARERHGAAEAEGRR